MHLALRDDTDLRTESQGEAAQRHVVVVPQNYKPTARAGKTPMRPPR